jgi:hypothetical protein
MFTAFCADSLFQAATALADSRKFPRRRPSPKLSAPDTMGQAIPAQLRGAPPILTQSRAPLVTLDLTFSNFVVNYH